MRAMVTAILLAGPAWADEWADFQKMSKDKDPDVRIKAIEAIDQHKNLQMAQALLPLFADPHPRVRYYAMRAVGKCKDGAVAEFIVKSGLKHGVPLVRQLTCEALAWIKNETTIDALAGMIGDSDAGVRAQACDALGWLKAKPAVDALLAAFDKDKAWEVRAWALDAAGRIDGTRVAEACEKASADKAYQVRMQAMMTAVQRDVPKEVGLKVFKAIVADADWRVRVQAIEGATEVRHRECVGLLVEQFLKEKARLRLDLWLALTDLTEKELGLEPKPWKDWWEANKDTFEPVAKKSAKNGQPVPGGGGTRAEFFKIPILSNRISFVLDLSGSMREDAPGGGTGSGGKKQTKLDVAKQGMAKTIGEFTQDVHFNIVNLGCDKDGKYDKKNKIWKPKLTPAADPMKKDATKFVQGQEAKGWTNIWDGIEYAFEDDEVDTIFHYSDGGASRGVWTSSWDILTMLERMNRYRKIMIFSVETPGTKANTEDNIKLLKDMAEKTKGAYRLAETR